MFGLFKKTFLSQITGRAQHIHAHAKQVIIFCEVDPVIIQAAHLIIKKKIAHPLILGSSKEILAVAKSCHITLPADAMYDFLEDKSTVEDFTKAYFDLRTKAGKTLTMEDAKAKMIQSHYFGGMMVEKGLANGMICGMHSQTKPYGPAFEIIKTVEGVTKASGLFFMEDAKSQKLFLLADCALNIKPTAEELAQIALTTAKTAVSFGIKPKIAMLSFSTHGSAKHELVDVVSKATAIVKAADKDLIIDGEIQLDAAIIPEVAQKKCPDSVLKGEANVLIFPDLNSGNISYKLLQRLGGYTAIGPVMQGLNKPINDISRGASVEDVVTLAALTVVQGQ